MVDISNKRLDDLKKSFDGKRIAVVGDMMLDGYYWGDVKRISPEAPVPVLEVEDEFFRFGGAANVAYNILTLGGIPCTCRSYRERYLREHFFFINKEKNIEDEGIIIDNERPTTTKTRIIADNQHIVRIDKESKAYISSKLEEKISIFLASVIDSLDGIILQDYNKGILTPSLITKIISIANKKNILITVDPKFDNFFEYKNVTVFKPNRKETETVLGTRIKDDKDISSAGRNLVAQIKFEICTT